jgi:hypothetical protein
MLGLARQQIGPVTPTLSGAATVSGDSVAAAQILMGVQIIPPWSDRAPVDVGAVVAFYGIAEGDRAQSRTLYMRQHLLHDRGGFWLGGGFGQIDRNVSFASNGIDAGGWIVWGRKRISATVSTMATNDRELFVSTAVEPEQFAEHFRVADGALTVEYATKRINFETTVGGRAAIEGLKGSRAYAFASFAWRLSRSTQIVFSGGSQLADPLRGTPEWKFASAGVRVGKSSSGSVIPRGPAAPPISYERLDNGQVRFVIDAPFSAASVELAGSFNQWVPVELDLVGTVWTITLPASPGAHQLKVRVNGGEWRVPSNLTTGRDEYRMPVGIIILR